MSPQNTNDDRFRSGEAGGVSPSPPSLVTQPEPQVARTATSNNVDNNGIKQRKGKRGYRYFKNKDVKNIDTNQVAAQKRKITRRMDQHELSLVSDGPGAANHVAESTRPNNSGTTEPQGIMDFFTSRTPCAQIKLKYKGVPYKCTFTTPGFEKYRCMRYLPGGTSLDSNHVKWTKLKKAKASTPIGKGAPYHCPGTLLMITTTKEKSITIAHKCTHSFAAKSVNPAAGSTLEYEGVPYMCSSSGNGMSRYRCLQYLPSGTSVTSHDAEWSSRSVAKARNPEGEPYRCHGFLVVNKKTNEKTITVAHECTLVSPGDVKSVLMGEASADLSQEEEIYDVDLEGVLVTSTNESEATEKQIRTNHCVQSDLAMRRSSNENNDIIQEECQSQIRYDGHEDITEKTAISKWVTRNEVIETYPGKPNRELDGSSLTAVQDCEEALHQRTSTTTPTCSDNLDSCNQTFRSPAPEKNPRGDDEREISDLLPSFFTKSDENDCRADRMIDRNDAILHLDLDRERTNGIASQMHAGYYRLPLDFTTMNPQDNHSRQCEGGVGGTPISWLPYYSPSTPQHQCNHYRQCDACWWHHNYSPTIPHNQNYSLTIPHDQYYSPTIPHNQYYYPTIPHDQYSYYLQYDGLSCWRPRDNYTMTSHDHYDQYLRTGGLSSSFPSLVTQSNIPIAVVATANEKINYIDGNGVAKSTASGLQGTTKMTGECTPSCGSYLVYQGGPYEWYSTTLDGHAKIRCLRNLPARLSLVAHDTEWSHHSIAKAKNSEAPYRCPGVLVLNQETNEATTIVAHECTDSFAASVACGMMGMGSKNLEQTEVIQAGESSSFMRSVNEAGHLVAGAIFYNADADDGINQNDGFGYEVQQATYTDGGNYSTAARENTISVPHVLETAAESDIHRATSAYVKSRCFRHQGIPYRRSSTDEYRCRRYLPGGVVVDEKDSEWTKYKTAKLRTPIGMGLPYRCPGVLIKSQETNEYTVTVAHECTLQSIGATGRSLESDDCSSMKRKESDIPTMLDRYQDGVKVPRPFGLYSRKQPPRTPRKNSYRERSMPLDLKSTFLSKRTEDPKNGSQAVDLFCNNIASIDSMSGTCDPSDDGNDANSGPYSISYLQDLIDQLTNALHNRKDKIRCLRTENMELKKQNAQVCDKVRLLEQKWTNYHNGFNNLLDQIEMYQIAKKVDEQPSDICLI